MAATLRKDGQATKGVRLAATKKEIAGMLYALDVPETTIAKILHVSRQNLNKRWKNDPEVTSSREQARKIILKTSTAKIQKYLTEVEYVAMAFPAKGVSSESKLKALFALLRMHGKEVEGPGVGVVFTDPSFVKQYMVEKPEKGESK